MKKYDRQPLTARVKEDCQNDNCKKIVQDLKNKVRLKSEIIKKLQGTIKINGKAAGAEFLVEYEKLLADKEAAVKDIARLTKENEMLGQIIEKLKAQQYEIKVKEQEEEKAKIEYSNEELKKALLDLTDEFENYKKTHEINQSIIQNYNNLKMEYENVMQSHKDEIASLESLLINTKGELASLQTKYSNEINSLLENNKKLNDSYEELSEKYEFYKAKYIEEVKQGNKQQERQKGLLAEIQTHVQYIAILEQQTADLESKLTKYTGINYESQRANYYLSQSSRYNSLPFNPLEEELEKERARNKDLSGQVQLLSTSKETAQTNLSICRHNLLQHCIELQESQDKLIALEKMRLSDLLHISRLEDLLRSNDIKY